MTKITSFQIENVKRVKAVKVEPNQNGLTIIGGKNEQGKTSILDGIAWALGGERFAPSEPHREGSMLDPYLHVRMSNGIVVERKGKNSDLKVIDSTGKKGGQQLLNEFIEQLALDLPKFMAMTNKEKAQKLLQIIGIGDQLYELEQAELVKYNERTAIGQIAERKKKFAEEQEFYSEAPKDLISPSELIKTQQEILARNGENQKKREDLEYFKNRQELIRDQISALYTQMSQLQAKIDERQEALEKAAADVAIASKTAEQLQDESTAELEEQLRQVEEINLKVRKNLDKEKAEEDAKLYADQYNTLTAEIEKIRENKMKLLNEAQLPLPGLSVENGELTYQGHKWDNMSSSAQMIVSTAIIRQLNPKCEFILLDKLEAMDIDTLKEFGAWLENEGLQAIATRVSTGEECSIIIEDGHISGQELESEETPAATPPQKTWSEGEF